MLSGRIVKVDPERLTGEIESIGYDKIIFNVFDLNGVSKEEEDINKLAAQLEQSEGSFVRFRTEQVGKTSRRARDITILTPSRKQRS